MPHFAVRAIPEGKMRMSTNCDGDSGTFRASGVSASQAETRRSRGTVSRDAEQRCTGWRTESPTFGRLRLSVPVPVRA